MEVEKPGTDEEEPRGDPVRSIGEIVLAYHGGLLYEAKVLDVKPVKGQPGTVGRYRVHFQGWRKSWDADVLPNEVLEHSDENLRYAHELLKRVQKRGALASAANPPEAEDEGKKNGKDSSKSEDADKEEKNTESLFVIPGPLKRQLVDDWEFVTKERKLVSLPRDYTVTKILESWLTAKIKSKSGCDKASKEVAEGLQEYFDAALPVFLLYRFERPQYDMFFRPGGKAKGQRPSDLYGAEHLLRLIIKLPFMLHASGLERPVIKQIAEKVNELMRFLQKNGRIAFLTDYEAAGSSYLARFKDN